MLPLRLETPDNTQHPGMAPLEEVQRLAASVDRVWLQDAGGEAEAEIASMADKPSLYRWVRFSGDYRALE